MRLTIEKEGNKGVVLKDGKEVVKVSYEVIKDLNNMHGIDVTDELRNALQWEVNDASLDDEVEVILGQLKELDPLYNKVYIVQAIDPMTFIPKIGVKFNREFLIKFEGEESTDIPTMVNKVKTLLGEEHHKEVDRAFLEFKYRNLSITQYQEKAVATAIYGDGQKIIYPTLGLTGEAGEVADKVKKVLRDNNGEFTPEAKLEIAKEIGDVCWYIAALCRDLGFSMAEVCQMNLDKLESRQKRNVISGSGDNR